MESHGIRPESDSRTEASFALRGLHWVLPQGEEHGAMSSTCTVGSDRRHRAGAATVSLLLERDEGTPATARERLSHELS